MRFTLLLIALLMVPSLTIAQKKVTIVIDPGHGGHDPGHESHNSNLLPEKTLNLKISKYLGGYIEKYLQNVKVVYTRTTDTYPSLDDRVEMANRINADYFISIHCNGNDRKSVRGTETHVHSMHLNKSVRFARDIEKQFSQRAGRKSRGVKDQQDLQHSLQVLKYTNMTSILVECGFLTNPTEANFLNTTYGQEIIASAIFRGFRSTIEREYPNTAFRKPAGGSSTTTTSNEVVSTPTSGKFAIQIASSRKPVDTKSDPGMRKVGLPVERKKIETTSPYKYVYLVGTYDSRSAAKQALKTIQGKGFKDAIIVKR